jgi:hypothetical protein
MDSGTEGALAEASAVDIRKSSQTNSCYKPIDKPIFKNGMG